MNRMRVLPALLGALAGAASPLAAQDFEWRGRVAAGEEIEIRNIVGDIEALASTGSQVEVVAEIRGRSRDIDRIDFEVDEHRDGVTVCVILLDRRGRRGRNCRGSGDGDDWGDLDVNVHFEIRVPQGVRLVANTVSGDVVVDDLASEVVARTVSGDIEVTTNDVATAATVSGNIRAAIGRTDWRGTLAFTTVTGDVYLEVPDGLNADVEFSAVSGEFESDFRIAMSGRRFILNHIRGTIGEGGRDLKLTTVSGDVTLVRN